MKLSDYKQQQPHVTARGGPYAVVAFTNGSAQEKEKKE